MAKYQDYVGGNQDELDQEIDDASQRSEDRRAGNPDIPERFANKSAEEIAQSYVELERRFSQQGNDLGEMRKTLDEFIRVQSAPEVQTREPEKKASIDDLYEDADTTIRRVVQKETGDRIARLEQELAAERSKAQIKELSTRYDGWEAEVQKPEFVEWVKSAPYRLRLAQLADTQGDTVAAEGLLDMWWKEGKNDAPARRDDVRRASLESGGGRAASREVKFSRTELLKKRLAAKRGDPNAIEYMTNNAEAIAIAYEKGRITD